MTLRYLATIAPFTLTNTCTLARVPLDATDEDAREIVATAVRCSPPLPDTRPREIAKMGTVKQRYLCTIAHQVQPGYRLLHDGCDYHLESATHLIADLYQLTLELDT